MMLVRDPSRTASLGASITCLHGFLTSVISGPLIMPSEWLPIVFNHANEETAWETMEQAQEAIALTMRFNNEVSRDLESGRFSIMIDRVGDDPDTVDYADDWCHGYMVGVAMRPDEWADATKDDEALNTWTLPIRALADADGESVLDPIKSPDVYAEILDSLPECAYRIYEWWRERLVGAPVAAQSPVRRARPKISPNAPCPCGSGKKYKRCCSPLRVV